MEQAETPTEPAPVTKRIAIAVVEHDGQYLIGQRLGNVPLAGYWEFPGGKVELGESAEEAAVRECREETWLVVAVRGLISDHVHQYDHGRLQLQFFACAAQDVLAEPRPPYRWVQRQQLGDYRFPDGNRPLLDILLNFETKQAAGCPQRLA